MKSPLAAVVSTSILLAVVSLTCTTSAPAQNGNGLVWSTYFGGSAGEGFSMGSGMRVLANGDLLVWGGTRSDQSQSFPLRGAALGTHGGGSDGFVARLRGDGRAVVWCTYLGGSSDDFVRDAVVDASGVITVCGVTRSRNFPTTPGAFQTTAPGPQNGSANGFVTRLVWNGSRLQILWSTYLGGSVHDSAASLQVHPTGSVVVAGTTNSTDFPIPAGTSPYQRNNAGAYDGFLAVLESTGRSLRASTYLGGSARDFASLFFGNEWSYNSPLMLDSAGNPVVAGMTESSNIPTTPNALQRVRQGSVAMYVARLDIGLTRLRYGSFLGGDKKDACWDAVIDSRNRIVLTGTTTSSNFPTTTGAHQRTFGGGGCGPYQYAGDGFVTILDTSLRGSAQLVWSTYLGKSGCDLLQAVAVDRLGLVTVAGQTGSTDFPVTRGARQRKKSASTDNCITRFDPAKSGSAQLDYSTYLGGDGVDNALGLDVDDLGNVVVGGVTNSSNFPTTAGVIQTRPLGGYDVFLTKLSMLPTPMYRYGASTPACLWPIHQGAESQPYAGNQNFTVYARGAPANAPGTLLLGLPNLPGVQWMNLRLYVNGPFVLLFGMADSSGRASLRLPAPNPLPKYVIASQWFFPTSASCPGTGTLAASEGMLW